MFLNLAAQFAAQQGGSAESVFLIHPLQLSRWLDEAWNAAAGVPPLPGVPGEAPFLGASIVDVLNLPEQPAALLDPSGIDLSAVDVWTDQRGPTQPLGTNVGLIWQHLMYAYLIESTGVHEVMAEVVKRLVIGESLGELSLESTKWLRATEELFFREPPLFSIAGVVSELRPYVRINRRNAYWRMFGFDLPHPVPSAAPGGGTSDGWKQGLGNAANTDFRAKWTELLRQVWMGLKNSSNQSGANPTDQDYVALLCKALKDMMTDRRRGGQLAREEFAYVTALSWFHLTIRSNTPIVQDLKATANFEDERLSIMASRVGMTPSARTRELVQLAEPVSALLRAIELGFFDKGAQAAALFTGNTQLTEDMNRIINLWQSATGDRVKDTPVTTSAPPDTQPLRIPKPAEMVASNGSGG